MECVRCEKHGIEREPFDYRTLKMSCLYDMNELDVPFESEQLECGKEFSLQVCKPCRADWLETIEKWFNNLYVKFGDIRNGEIKIKEK